MVIWQTVLMLSVGATMMQPVDGPAVDLGSWSHSLGREALSPLDGQAGLRAAFRFTKPEQTEPLFITRQLNPRPLRNSIVAVTFRYRFQVDDPAGAAIVPLDPERGFKVRLRTSPTTFTDHDVPRPVPGYPTQRWVDVRVETSFGSKVRNIYRDLFENPNVMELTFRLDDGDGPNFAGWVELSDIALEVEEAAIEGPYTPQPSPRPRDDVLNVLAIRQSMDGYYDLPEAVALLSGETHVTEGLFRGLHFPIFEFPATRAEVLKQDVIFLGDVDPYVLTTEQLHWIADAVHSGTGLFVAAGPNSFGNAKRQPPALLDLLPVQWEPEVSPLQVDADPRLGPGLPVTLGALGEVRRLVPVTAKPGAQVLLSSGGHPLFVAGQAGQGRVLVVTSWAQPTRLDDGSFMTTPLWHTFAAQLLAKLAGRQPATTDAPIESPTVDVAWQYGHRTLAPGYPFGLQVSAVETRKIELALVTDEGQLWRWSGEVGPEPKMVADVCPQVAVPQPRTVAVAVNGQPIDGLDGVLTTPLDRDGFYPLICYLPTEAGNHSLDAAGVEAMVQDVYDHGFNTIAIGGFGSARTAHLSSQLKGLAERAAAERGMAVILEYTNATGLRRDKVYEVSPFSPDFGPWLAERLGDGFEQARSMPRLLSVKLTDEPTVSPAVVPRDEATQQAAKRLTGEVVLDPTKASKPSGRWAYGKLASTLVEQDFAAVRQLADRAGVPWDLCVTYFFAGFGGTSPSRGMEDAWHWTRPAERFDFDVYPYFYPSSERIRFLQADWGFAASRAMSRAMSEPWGFYIELDDRNWPFQQNPAEASAECAYAAVAAGADYLNSFIHRGFGTGNMARPERWEKAGQALREIRELGPLLTRLPRQPARVAVLWPETQNWSHDGYQQPVYTRALLAQGLGDCDVIHESELMSGLPSSLDMLTLVGIDALSADAAVGLRAWIRAGGTVWCDGLPSQDERGAPLDWTGGWGDGTVVEDDSSLETAMRDKVEGDDRRDWQDLLILFDKQVRPRLRPHRELFSIRMISDPKTGEVGIRTDGRTALVGFVNHSPEPQRMTVELRSGPFVPQTAKRLPDGSLLDCKVAAGTVTLTIDVPGRWGRMVMLE